MTFKPNFQDFSRDRRSKTNVRRKEKYVGFRDEEEIINLIDAVVADRGMDRSDFIREVIRKRLADLSFFSEKTKKALGVWEVEP